jgi:salicylate hydroxylase
MTSIGIIGGGIGGLVAGLALQQAGFAPVIYERAPGFGEVGAGLSISPNAAHGLIALGFADWIAAHANEPLEQCLFHGKTDETLRRFDRRTARSTYGAPYVQVHRADLHRALAERLGLQSCRFSAELARMDEKGTLIFTNGTSATHDVVIAADGLRSIVRDTLFDPDPPTFSGHIAWRSLVPATLLGPEYVQRRNTNHVGPGCNFVVYPVRGESLVNIVALTRSDTWVEESWAAKGDIAKLRQHFMDWCPYVQRALDAMPAETLYHWGLFIRRPLERWVKGHVALLGDAAHPMLPYMGQGASSAIEDGIVLGRAFAAEADPAKALALYEGSRVKRTAFLQAESNLGGDRLQALDPYVLRDMPVQNEDALGIFKYNPVTALLQPGTAKTDC